MNHPLYRREPLPVASSANATANTTAGGGAGLTATAGLAAHLTVCEEILALVTRESEALRQPGPFAGQELARERAALVPRLAQSLEAIRSTREAWQRLDPATRERHSEVHALLRANQNLIMKVIVLDRENEQALLRRGLLPPGRLPMSQSRRPRLVADEYLKNRAV